MALPFLYRVPVPEADSDCERASSAFFSRRRGMMLRELCELFELRRDLVPEARTVTDQVHKIIFSRPRASDRETRVEEVSRAPILDHDQSTDLQSLTFEMKSRSRKLSDKGSCSAGAGSASWLR